MWYCRMLVMAMAVAGGNDVSFLVMVVGAAVMLMVIVGRLAAVVTWKWIQITDKNDRS